MSTRAGRAVCCVLVLLMMSLSPMVAPASVKMKMKFDKIKHDILRSPP